MASAVVEITGNTFQDQIRNLGGRWDLKQKTWMIPAAKADEARKLCAGEKR